MNRPKGIKLCAQLMATWALVYSTFFVKFETLIHFAKLLIMSMIFDKDTVLTGADKDRCRLCYNFHIAKGEIDPEKEEYLIQVGKECALKQTVFELDRQKSEFEKSNPDESRRVKQINVQLDMHMITTYGRNPVYPMYYSDIGKTLLKRGGVQTLPWTIRHYIGERAKEGDFPANLAVDVQDLSRDCKRIYEHSKMVNDAISRLDTACGTKDARLSYKDRQSEAWVQLEKKFIERKRWEYLFRNSKHPVSKQLSIKAKQRIKREQREAQNNY